jgi:hypothetical protein
MKSVLTCLSAAAMLSLSAQADIGPCKKPTDINVPANVETMSLSEFKRVHTDGETYLTGAKQYLKCLDQIIYSTVPEDPIVNKAGKEHQTYAQEWGPVWGTLNMACINWEASHGSQFPGGCQPSNPAG